MSAQKQEPPGQHLVAPFQITSGDYFLPHDLLCNDLLRINFTSYVWRMHIGISLYSPQPG